MVCAYTAKAFCNTPLKDLTFQQYKPNEKKSSKRRSANYAALGVCISPTRFESSNHQYMLGEKNLVAPLVDKGDTRIVKLPVGNWVNDLGKKYKGGQTVTTDVPLNRHVYLVLQYKK